MFKAYATAATLLLASAFNGVQAADSVVDLPAGLACADFDLRIEITGNPHRVFRQFTDKNGNVVYLFAGKQNSLSFTNLNTGATLALRPKGGVERSTYLPDGSTLATFTGHNVLILFPSDVPAGPTSTLYVGQVTLTIDNTTGVFTLGRTAGKSVDLCAALSG